MEHWNHGNPESDRSCPAKQQQVFRRELSAYPDTSYYCKLWSEAFRKGALGGPICANVEEGSDFLSTPHPGGRIGFLKDDEPLPERYPQSVAVLDNLLRSPCRLASKEELHFWKTMACIAGGKFKLAKGAALEGRRHARGDRCLKFFTTMAAFRDEADFRNAVFPPEKQAVIRPAGRRRVIG